MSAARRGLAGSAAVMFAGTAVSRVLGLVRNAVLALVLTVNVAGAANAFSVANKLPNIIFMLVAGGVLNAVLVPQIVRAMRREDGGQEYVDRLLTVTATALALLTLLLTAGAGLLVSLYGRRLDEWYPLAVAFAFWAIPQLFFYGLYTLLGQVLNARSSFGPYMWAPAVNNLVAIAGLGVFVAVYGTAATNDGGDVAAWTPERIALLAGTATLGVAAQALVLLVPLYRSGFRWRPRWGLRGTGLGRASKVALWAFAGLAVGQLGYLAVSNVAAAAATAGGGAADVAGNAAYDNAFLIYMLPQSLITVSLVTALFTRMSEAAAAQDLGKVRADLSLGLRTVGVFTVFASVALAVLAVPIVRVVLPTVTLDEARSVAAVTVAMLTGLAALGAWTLIQRVYYAFEDARSLFFIQIPMAGIVAVGSVAGALLLAPRWWVPVAGLAMAASTITGAVVAYLRLRLRLYTLDGSRVLRTHVRLALAASAAGAIGWGLLHLLGIGPGDSAGITGVLVASLIRVVLVGAVMVAVYLVLLHRLGVTELDLLLRPAVRLLSGAGRRVRTMTRGRGERTGVAGGPALAADHRPDAPEGADGAPDAAREPTPTDGSTAAAEASAAPGAGASDDELAEADGAEHRTDTNERPEDDGEQDGDDRRGGGTAVTQAATHERMASSGTVLAGRYRLTELLHTDLPDAEAWRGHDTILDRPVQALLVGGQRTRETLDAARRAALVDDSRLARVLGVGASGESGYVVTEVVRGPDLAEVLADGPLAPDQARAVVGEAASALEAARRRGVHHLALRPTAIHVTPDGQVMITGLGVDAAQRGKDSRDYWSSSRADAVALVGLLYLSLTGTAPSGTNPAPPAEVRPEVPAELSALCTTTLAEHDDVAVPGPQNPAELIRELAPWTEVRPFATGNGRSDEAPADSGAERSGRKPGVSALGRTRPLLRGVLGHAPQPASGAAEPATSAPESAPAGAATAEGQVAVVGASSTTPPPDAAAVRTTGDTGHRSTEGWAPPAAVPVDDGSRPAFAELIPAAPAAATGVRAVLSRLVPVPRHLRIRSGAPVGTHVGGALAPPAGVAPLADESATAEPLAVATPTADLPSTATPTPEPPTAPASPPSAATPTRQPPTPTAAPPSATPTAATPTPAPPAATSEPTAAVSAPEPLRATTESTQRPATPVPAPTAASPASLPADDTPAGTTASDGAPVPAAEDDAAGPSRASTLAAVAAATGASLAAAGRRAATASAPALRATGTAIAAAAAAVLAWLVSSARGLGHGLVLAARTITAPARTDAGDTVERSGTVATPVPTGRFDPTPYVLAIALALVIFGLMWAVDTLISAAGTGASALPGAVSDLARVALAGLTDGLAGATRLT